MRSAAPTPATPLRPDIQGLRGIAVALVFLFHTWPALVPGGFVGVDVFFVVSGYLVCGLLLRELDRTGGGVDFGAFYGRRIRRLLPAATLVLLAVGVTAPLLPATRWHDVARDTIASVLYVQNWNLAARAVDYHAEGNAASPLQHFWSLSIEEQFYLFVPAFLLLAHRVGRVGPAVVLGLAALLSLAASVRLSGDPTGYFVSHARVWELAVGGLLAALPRAGLPGAAGAVGLAVVFASAWIIGPDSAFPGWLALLPTLGCVAVLAAGGKGVAAQLLGSRPLVWIGDRSYSIYLWHWPLVVLWTAHGGALGPLSTLAIGLLTAALSIVSHRHVEERFRHVGPRVPRAPVLALGSLVPLAFAVGFTLHGGPTSAESHRHPGGAVLFGAATVEGVAPIPDPSVIREHENDGVLLLRYDETVPQRRQAGVPGGLDVRLVGDSHAQAWEPALREVAKARGWSLTVDVKMACALSPRMIERQDAPYEACHTWGQAVLADLEASPPAMVILSHTSRQRPWQAGDRADEAMADGMREVWRRLAARGTLVVAVPDVPRWNVDPVECYLQDPACTMLVTEGREYADDLVRGAAAGNPDVRLLDLEDLVCPDGVCRPVIGNVFVYRDNGHLTEAYAATLHEEIGRRLDAILASGAR